MELPAKRADAPAAPPLPRLELPSRVSLAAAFGAALLLGGVLAAAAAGGELRHRLVLRSREVLLGGIEGALGGKRGKRVFGDLALTTVRCVEGGEGDAGLWPDVHRACEFTNLYWKGGKGQGEWVAVMGAQEYAKTMRSVTLRSKHGHAERPRREEPGKELEVRMANSGGLRVERGVHLLFSALWTHNIGHALWDGLYAAWVAAVRLGHGNVDGVLKIVVEQADEAYADGSRLQFDHIVERFSGEGRYTQLRELRAKDGWVRFEVVLAGSGAKGQRWMNSDLRLPGFEEGAVRLFRDRMYRGYGIAAARPWTEGRRRTDARAIIVDNKRYTDKERSEMASLISVARNHGYNMTYVDWGKLGVQPDNFGAHLEVLRDTDVYISGPGTGMMYAPFLPDKAVFVGLGALVGSDAARWVTYMEEYVCEGTPYVRALYYPSRLRAGGVRLQVLAGLFDTAVDLTTNGFAEPPEPGVNLSVEGRLFKRACAAVPRDCQYVLDGMNTMRPGTWNCLLEGWVDFVVYESGHYNETQPVKEDGEIHAECMNHGFREALRKEVRDERARSNSLGSPCANPNNCQSLLQYHIKEVEG